jgi:hypothetical protein
LSSLNTLKHWRSQVKKCGCRLGTQAKIKIFFITIKCSPLVHPWCQKQAPHGRMGHHVHKITCHIAIAHRAQQGKWQAGSSFLEKESIFHSWPAWKEKSLCSYLSQFAPSFCSPRARIDADPSILISAATAKFGSWTRAHDATAPSTGQRFIRAALTPGNLASDVLCPAVYRSTGLINLI